MNISQRDSIRYIATTTDKDSHYEMAQALLLAWQFVLPVEMLLEQIDTIRKNFKPGPYDYNMTAA